ncbi:hypothetical protein BJ138DRAFT_1003084 [Hygrophoropsis aurantiaca]|uniref:Uncharacterized protein n=1 Tax=Hygrophoropsis aurantiaca TaxID=72124 RepID=A0ACB8AIR5_9AGAM|nr:hypothetical protein BJ138DRAFT_1003084 [Hygrophoropsis aurantiaca]
MDFSPSSSPALGPMDSSPLSSPTLEPCQLDSPPSCVSFVHPFAGSTKATKRPPQHEKKSDTPPCTPIAESSRQSGLYRGTRSLEEDDYLHVDPMEDSPEPHRTLRYLDHEESLWDDALRIPFDTGVGRVDLTNKRLKSIPPTISDLSRFFNTSQTTEPNVSGGRALSRVTTEPDVSFPRTRSIQRTKSIVDSEQERDIVQIYLAGNNISILPPELFDIEKLTVLTLRGNYLTHIPHDICRLRSLRELNISQNRLTYLPSEMSTMTLSNLLVYPNPFLSEPSRSRAQSSNLCQPSTSPVAKFLGPVPPLTELCLRRLLSPVEHSDTHAHTVLLEYYGVPLPDHWDDYIPSNIRDMLASCVRGVFKARPHVTDRVARDPPLYIGVGTCVNPEHHGRLFVKHAAERFTWERKLAGVDVGGAVPLRWRGCLQSCLDFLDRGAGTRTTVNLDLLPPRMANTRTVQPNPQMDIDMDAIQVVDLAGPNFLARHDFDD